MQTYEEKFVDKLKYEEKQIYFTQYLPIVEPTEKLDNELLDLQYQLSNEYDKLEGTRHFNWLISEYGEDVFSDRD